MLAALRNLSALLLFLATPLVAQEYRYHVYIDLDANTSTGCRTHPG